MGRRISAPVMATVILSASAAWHTIVLLPRAARTMGWLGCADDWPGRPACVALDRAQPKAELWLDEKGRRDVAQCDVTGWLPRDP